MSVERALLAAFTSRIGPVEILAHDMTPWSSATFSGARHVFRIEAKGATDREMFAREIGNAEIAIPRGFVADVTVVEMPADAVRRLTIEALTIDA